MFRIKNIQTSAYVNVPSKNHTANSESKIQATQTAWACRSIWEIQSWIKNFVHLKSLLKLTQLFCLMIKSFRLTLNLFVLKLLPHRLAPIRCLKCWKHSTVYRLSKHKVLTHHVVLQICYCFILITCDMDEGVQIREVGSQVSSVASINLLFYKNCKMIHLKNAEVK